MAATYKRLTRAEVKDLTAMVWGAPCSDEWIDDVAVPLIRKAEHLRSRNQRPEDPVKRIARKRKEASHAPA